MAKCACGTVSRGRPAADGKCPKCREGGVNLGRRSKNPKTPKRSKKGAANG